MVTTFLFFFFLCSADQALDRFAMRRFYEDKALPVGQPSQKRWDIMCFLLLVSRSEFGKVYLFR